MHAVKARWKRLSQLSLKDIEVCERSFQKKNLPSISAFYAKLYACRSQKLKKDGQDGLFVLLGSAQVKAACKLVDEIDPRCQFHQHKAYFTRADPQSAKRQSSCQSFLPFWDLRL